MKARTLLVAALVALLQVGFLGWMIAGRAAILRNGQEALLKVEPVDPRDFLRGDYVWLGYDISRIPVSIVANLPAFGSNVDEGPVFVRIGKDADGYWRARSASLGASTGAPAAGEIEIRGTVFAAGPIYAESQLSATYGIERFYVPEGEGMQIQNDMNVRSFGILVAVGDDGTAQIKALMDGDQRVYEEPPF